MPLAAPKIEHILREVDVRKASTIFGVDEASLRKLNNKALLNAEFIRDSLIRHDYKKLIEGLELLSEENKNYTYPEAIKAVCGEYHITRKALTQILNSRSNINMLFCVKCGKRIPKAQYDRTKGLCEDCFIEKIDL